MEKEAQELLSWLDGATKYQLPSYDELPHVPLYMEQVVGYINDILAPLTPDKKRQLTSFMKTNVIGSNNVITACVANHVKNAVFLSTDKAAYPINAM